MPDLSSMIPIAQAHLWAGQKDEARTVSRARRLVEVFDPQLDDYTPLDARAALLTFTPGSRNRYRASLSSLLRAYRLTGGPRLELPPLFPEAKPRDRVLTDREIEELLASSMGKIAMLLIDTGFRISELYRAEFTGTTFYLADTKNGHAREIPATDRCRRQLPGPGRVSALLDLPSERTLRRLWKRETDVGFHALRHTAITRWVARGVPLPAVMALAGHRSLQTSLRYTHLSAEDLRGALLAAE